MPAYDFGWQTLYVLSEPMILPKGSRIDCEAHFDNSSNNPYNPDPTKLVRWGEQTFEEMMIGYVDVDVPVGSPPPIEKTELAPPRSGSARTRSRPCARATTGGNPPGTNNQKARVR